MPNETVLAAQALRHIVQQAGEQLDNPVAVEIAVSIVELLEMIQIRVTHRERFLLRHAPRDLGFDLNRSR